MQMSFIYRMNRLCITIFFSLYNKIKRLIYNTFRPQQQKKAQILLGFIDKNQIPKIPFIPMYKQCALLYYRICRVNSNEDLTNLDRKLYTAG